MKKIAKKDEGRVVEACGDEWVAPLANAIIEKIADCYKAACRFEDLYPDEARLLKEDCVEFFKSDWYEALTNFPRDRMISKLERGDWSDFSVTNKEFESMLESFGVKKRLAVMDYYKASVEPALDAILRDLRGGMKFCVAKKVYGITSLRWSQCRECVPGFKDATDAARAEGEKALKECKGRKSETEKFLAVNLPYIRSRLDAGDTRAEIAKNLKVSFYRLKTFLDARCAEAARAAAEEAEKAAPKQEIEASIEDERAARARLDRKGGDKKERLLDDLRKGADDLPEGVAAQRPKDARDPSKEDGEGDDES